MQDLSLIYLLYLGIIILAGLLFTVISKKIKIPASLLLVLFGISLANITQISFPPIFLSAFAVLALSLVAFDSSSRFNIHRFDAVSLSALTCFSVYFILSIFLLSLAIWTIFKPANILFALLFATAVSGSS